MDGFSVVMCTCETKRNEDVMTFRPSEEMMRNRGHWPDVSMTRCLQKHYPCWHKELGHKAYLLPITQHFCQMLRCNVSHMSKTEM